MVATLTSIYHSEESLSIQRICAMYRGRPARARWGQNNRSVAQPAEYFRGGAQAIGTFSGTHWAVRCRATALRSLHRHFCLGRKLTLAAQEELVLLNSPRLFIKRMIRKGRALYMHLYKIF
jgi:hypothetical protein